MLSCVSVIYTYPFEASCLEMQALTLANQLGMEPFSWFPVSVPYSVAKCGSCSLGAVRGPCVSCRHVVPSFVICLDLHMFLQWV